MSLTPGNYSEAGTFLRPITQQFQSWYPAFATGFSDISMGQCNASLRDYQGSFISPSYSAEARYLLSICYVHEACILNHITSDWQANLNSAGVILGIMPTLLSSIGPSIAETSLLSAHRPFLSLLISMGAPAIWPTRIFKYNNPIHVLGGQDKLNLKPVKPWISAAISTMEYTFALVAIANNLSTSIELGNKTTLSWACTTTFAPLLWTTLPVLIHIVAAASFVTAIVGRRAKQHGSATLRSWPILLCRVLRGETTICANHQKFDYNHREVPRLAVSLSVFAGMLGWVHAALGIVIFSSLLFVGVKDVLHSVLWRYIVSSAVCRLILLIELGGLRNGYGLKRDGDSEEMELVSHGDNGIAIER